MRISEIESVTVGMKTEDAQRVDYAGFAVKNNVRGLATKKKERLHELNQLNGDPREV